MNPGKILILLGAILIVAGLFFLLGGKIPYIGKLPGDVRFQKDNFSFYFPLTTCIIISIIVTLLLWLFRR